MNLPSIKEQKEILKYLIEIPSLDNWEICDTKDRKEHWMYCKVFHLVLRSFLKNHFSGLPLPTRVPVIYITIKDSHFKIIPRNLDNYPSPFIQQIGLHLDYYLALYAVLSWGWTYIEPVLKESESSCPQTPGEALIEVMHEEFIGRFTTYFPEFIDGNYYAEFSPRKCYELKGKSTKIKLLEHKETLTDEEKKFISRYKHKVKKEKEKAMIFYRSLLFYITICEKNKAKDTVLENRLKNLAIAATAIKTRIDKLSHPRNKVKGHAVNKGVRIEAAKGGTYSL
jgi:hypothetical protein